MVEYACNPSTWKVEVEVSMWQIWSQCELHDTLSPERQTNKHGKKTCFHWRFQKISEKLVYCFPGSLLNMPSSCLQCLHSAPVLSCKCPKGLVCSIVLRLLLLGYTPICKNLSHFGTEDYFLAFMWPNCIPGPRNLE